VVVVGGDGHDLSVCDSDLRVERGEFQMLLVFFWAVVAARKRQNQGIVALQLAELAQFVRVIGQFEVRKNSAGHNISTHD
jgi:hypothetical protein